MNKQEYEHKKRECWEEFCRHIVDEEEAFYNMFDRAYALGKQKETITQEEIEKAAEKYDDKHTEQLIHDMDNDSTSWKPLQDGIRESFKAGANFALGKQEKGEENNIDLVKLNKQLDEALNSETKESLEEWMKRGDDSNTRLQIAAQLLSGLLASGKEKHPVRRAIELTDALMEELEKGK